MKIKNFAILGVAAAAMSALNSCTQDPYIIPTTELYTRAFIKEFGLIDPSQDWNLAQEGTVTVNVPGHANSVKVYAKVGETYYLVADLIDIEGSVTIPVDIPETTNDLMVKIDGHKYYTTPGGTVIFNAASRAQDNPVVVNGDVAGYWQMHAADATKFLEDLPEKHYNRNVETVIKDFLLVGTGEPIAIYPLYWNSSQTHTLGIYYFDTDNEDEQNFSHLVKVPIYTDKDDHLQMQKSKTTLLNLDWNNDASSTTQNLSWENGNNKSYYFTQTNNKYTFNVNFDFNNVNTPASSDDAKTSITDWINQYVKENSKSSVTDLCADGNFKMGLKDQISKEYDKNIIDVTLNDWGQLNVVATYFGMENGRWSGQSVAPEDLYDHIASYMSEKKYTSFSDLLSDTNFGSDINTFLANSSSIGLTGYTLGSVEIEFETQAKLTLISSSSGPKNPESQGATTNVWQYIIAQMEGKHSYNDLSGTEFTSGLDAAIKLDLGSTYSLQTWSSSSDGQSATITITSKPGPKNSTAPTNIYNLCLEYMDDDDDYSVLSDNATFKTALQSVVESIYGPSEITFTVAGGGKSATITINHYDNDWRAANAEGTESGTWYKRDGSTTSENIAGVNQTAYNSYYKGDIRSTGISVTIAEGLRYGFYIQFSNNVSDFTDGFINDDAGTIHYSEIIGNIENYERRRGTDIDETNPLNKEKFTYAAIYNKEFVGADNANKTYTYLGFEDWSDDEWNITQVQNNSDADLNDIIIAITGINLEKQVIDKSKKTESNDIELSWLIAAEDLGTTDDFDFNDVVFKLTSITTNKKETVEEKENGEVTSTTVVTEITKEVKIQALAAGGTLPVWLHYNNGTTDYILGPDRVVVNNGTVSQEDQNACEWHKWFRKSTSDMVNTGSGCTVSTPACLQIGYTKSTTPKASDDSSTWLIDAFSGDFSMAQYSRTLTDDKVEGFYITVGTITGEKMQALGGTTTSDITKATYIIGAVRTGAAPQMFLIPDVGNNGKWCWPAERHHILECYPTFKDWVTGGEASKEWHKDSPGSAVFNRSSISE